MKIKDCCKVIVPMRDKPKNFSGNIPWCRIDDIDGKFLNGSKNNLYVDQNTVEKMHLHVLPAGTVICAVTGASIGTYAITTTPLITNQTFAGIVCGDSTYNEYLYYFLKLYTKVLINLSVGCAQAYLTRESIENIDIGNLSFDQQVQKAKILKNIDEKIVYNNAISSQLESLAKTIYDYWFLQFDFPDENGNPYRSSGGKMVWNDELKREIPEGWTSKKLEELADFGNGINYDKDIKGDKDYKIVNVRNITSSSLLIDKSDLDDICLKQDLSDKYLINKNDILIARSGTPGAVRLLLDNDNALYCGFIIHCLPVDVEDRLYLTFSLKKYEGTNATKTGGSILQNVSQSTLKDLNIVYPNKEFIIKFNNKIQPLIDMMQNIIKENEELSSLRDFLLPLLMNGQVTFKED